MIHHDPLAQKQFDRIYSQRAEAVVERIVAAIRSEKYGPGVFNRETEFAVMFVVANRVMAEIEAERAAELRGE